MIEQATNLSCDKFDVVIAGGAMTGATLALMLDSAFSGALSIAVVEPFQVDQQHPGFDSRSIALSYGTVQILQHFQLWPEIEKVATTITHISVTDQGHAGMTDIDADRENLYALGYVVELADVGRLYQQLLAQSASISWLCPERIAQVDRSQDQVTIGLQQGQTITTKLLVAADGALSECSQQLGLALDEHDFHQVAVIANIGLDQPHQGRAFERFTASGPLALLPMSDNRMSLVWCVASERAEQLLQLDESDFLEQLQQQFGWRLGKLVKVGERVSYPLIMRSRPQTISHRFAVVGNAAQTLHPIAGQGFNLGIRDVVSLVESLLMAKNAAEESLDVGEYSYLNHYQNRRQTDRQLTMMMTSSLVHLFSNQWLPTMVGRNLGLMISDTIPCLNKPLLQRTLGLVSR